VSAADAPLRVQSRRVPTGSPLLLAIQEKTTPDGPVPTGASQHKPAQASLYRIAALTDR
jgi:hypothetical protein